MHVYLLTPSHQDPAGHSRHPVTGEPSNPPKHVQSVMLDDIAGDPLCAGHACEIPAEHHSFGEHATH